MTFISLTLCFLVFCCCCCCSPGIDLENIVYYKDDTHYFVMTAKKQSLLEKGVILHVSDRRLEVSGLSVNPERTMGGFSFCPFAFIFPSLLFSLMASLSRKLQERTDDSSLFSRSRPHSHFLPPTAFHRKPERLWI